MYPFLIFSQWNITQISRKILLNGRLGPATLCSGHIHQSIDFCTHVVIPHTDRKHAIYQPAFTCSPSLHAWLSQALYRCTGRILDHTPAYSSFNMGSGGFGNPLSKFKKRIKLLCGCTIGWFLLGVGILVTGIVLLIIYVEYWGDESYTSKRLGHQ